MLMGGNVSGGRERGGGLGDIRGAVGLQQSVVG